MTPSSPHCLFFLVCLWVFYTIRDLFLQSQNFYQIVNTCTVLGTSILTLVKTYRGKTLKDLLWTCATLTSLAPFEKSMDNLKKKVSLCLSIYKNIGPTHWTKSYFQSQFKCDILLNNMWECFNGHILEARIKGIVTMNEMIRTHLMIRIQKGRDVMKKITSTHYLRII